MSSHSLHGDKSKRDRSQTLTVAQGALSMDELALSKLDLSQFLEVGLQKIGNSGPCASWLPVWVVLVLLLWQLSHAGRRPKPLQLLELIAMVATPVREAPDCSASLSPTLTPAVLSIGPLAANSSIRVSPGVLTFLLGCSLDYKLTPATGCRFHHLGQFLFKVRP